MAVASEPDNTPLPGTVFTPRQVRVLKIAVIVMGILLVGGFAGVLIGAFTEDSGPTLIIVATMALAGVCVYLLGRPEEARVAPAEPAADPDPGP